MVAQKPASAPSFTKNQPAHPRSVKTSQRTMVAQKPASTPWITKNQPPRPASSKTSHRAQVTTDRKITKFPFTFFSNPLGVNRTLRTRISTSRGPILFIFLPRVASAGIAKRNQFKKRLCMNPYDTCFCHLFGHDIRCGI